MCFLAQLNKIKCQLLDLNAIILWSATCFFCPLFFTCVALVKAGLVVGPLRQSVRLSVHPQHFRVPSLCNPSLQKFSFFFIQTLPNDCSHIEDVHLLFCARFIIFFSYFRGVELRHFFHPQCLGGA